MQHFIKIGQTVAEIWRFNGFQNGGRPSFRIFKIKFFKRSDRLRDPFCIFISNSVTIGQTIAEISRFLWFSRWRPPPTWIIKNSNFLRSVHCREPVCVTVPKIISSKIGQTAAEIWRFNDFSRWRPFAIFSAYWDQSRRSLGGLYRSAKFGWNRWSSFDNIKLSIFCPFGLKTPIHAAKIGVCGNFTPQMGSNINETPKRQTLARVRIVSANKRENPSTVLTGRWVLKKRTQTSHGRPVINN